MLRCSQRKKEQLPYTIYLEDLNKAQNQRVK